MKKLSIFLLALVAVLGLAGCFDSKPTNSETQPGDETLTGGETQTGGDTQPEVELDTTKTYHLMGEAFGWADKAQNGVNVLAPTTVSALAENYASVAEALEGKELKGLYMLENVTFQSVDASWNPQAYGQLYNAGFSIKILDIVWEIDDEGDMISLIDNAYWYPGPTQHVESLTKDTLFLPAFYETTPEGGDPGLGTWNDNGVCIGGAGVYTVIFATYKGGQSSVDSYSAGLALVKTEAIKELTKGEKIQKEHEELKEGIVETPSTWSIEATVEQMTAVESEGACDVDLIVDVDGVKVAVSNAINNGVITSVDGLAVGTKINISGSIDKDAAAVEIGGVSASIVLTGASIQWEIVYYVRGSFTGASWDAVADYVLVKDASGNPTITLDLAVDAEFKVAEATWNDNTTKGYHSGLSASFADNGGNIKVVTAGTYKISIIDNTLVIESLGTPGQKAGVYLKGTMNEWSNNADYELVYNADGNMEITVDLTEGAEFKIADADWSAVNLGHHSGLDAMFFSGSNDGGNIKVLVTGTYKFVIEGGKIVAYPQGVPGQKAAVYVKGTMNEWSNNADYELTYDAEGNMVITLTLNVNDEFKVADSDWAKVNLGHHSGLDTTCFSGDSNNGNIKVLVAGTYKVSVVAGALVVEVVTE